MPSAMGKPGQVPSTAMQLVFNAAARKTVNQHHLSLQQCTARASTGWLTPWYSASSPRLSNPLVSRWQLPHLNSTVATTAGSLSLPPEQELPKCDPPDMVCIQLLHCLLQL
jgi:hypothetical protein